MDDITIRNSTRGQMEARIIDAANKVRILEPNWLDSSEIDEFISAWLDLETFYRYHKASDIGLEVIGVYRDFSRFLRQTTRNEDLDMHQRQRAEELLDSLEVALGEVVITAASNLDSNP